MKIRKMLMIALLFSSSVAVFGQAKKPTLMVMPSDAWCNEHGYMQTYDNQGSQEKVPDYKAAVSTDKQLNALTYQMLLSYIVSKRVRSHSFS